MILRPFQVTATDHLCPQALLPLPPANAARLKSSSTTASVGSGCEHHKCEICRHCIEWDGLTRRYRIIEVAVNQQDCTREAAVLSLELLGYSPAQVAEMGGPRELSVLIELGLRVRVIGNGRSRASPHSHRHSQGLGWRPARIFWLFCASTTPPPILLHL